jgi:hypothetical protein
MSFYIESVHDIVWNEDAFESLVAPQEQKDLILAFAKAQSKTRTNFYDFIQGKGKGIIMLLAGHLVSERRLLPKAWLRP